MNHSHADRHILLYSHLHRFSSADTHTSLLILAAGSTELVCVYPALDLISSSPALQQTYKHPQGTKSIYSSPTEMHTVQIFSLSFLNVTGTAPLEVGEQLSYQVQIVETSL